MMMVTYKNQLLIRMTVDNIPKNDFKKQEEKAIPEGKIAE